MRVRETKLVEVHGNDGADPMTVAKNWVKRWLAEEPESAPNCEVVGAKFSGQRCDHGALVVAVDFEYDGDDGSQEEST
jgi:hypothetical protein